MIIYRVHITCQAKHTTYTDYKTKRSATKRMNAGDIDGWYPTHITIIGAPLNRLQKDYLSSYQNNDLCSKFSNNIPLSELQAPEFMLLDSQDINSTLANFGYFVDPSKITGMVCSHADGDYSEVYITESGRPWLLTTIYHPISYYI